ncbi:hypothetical protein A0H81_06753 [Grifola frondosa]|uniref:Uncharacterized protein n=1 Tax=Grifola frondosa TaxID=5627 RepID=A0A1C7MD49_GRIFR|nr:hypothetical protein A0H81_06753 [Grifola frondosa]
MIPMATQPPRRRPHHRPSPLPYLPFDRPDDPTRRSSTSPSLSRAKPRNADAPSSPSSPTEGPGLVSYLQQMHGLTKKRSYGVRAPKRSLGVDLRLPNTTRPILPRLELPQSTVYTYPTFPSAHTPDAQVSVSVSESPKFPAKRHAEEQQQQQQPSSSLVARSNADNRRARRRGPWLPVAPLDSPAPTSASPNSSTRNALRHLASMTPRLPDILAAERQPTDPPAAQPSYPPFQPVGHGVDASYPPAYFDTREQPVVWSHNQPVLSPPAASPPDAPAGDKLFLQYHIARQLPGNPYSNSPMSSQSATPLPSPGLAAPASSGGGDAEDQPFVVTPEYEAFVNAQFEEAIRSGAMQASMTVTSALHSPISGLPSYAADMPLQQEQFVTGSSPLAQEPFGAEQEGYPFYPPYVAIATGPVAQNGGESWQGGADYAHAHNAAADYGPQPGWYPA